METSNACIHTWIYSLMSGSESVYVKKKQTQCGADSDGEGTWQPGSPGRGDIDHRGAAMSFI